MSARPRLTSWKCRTGSRCCLPRGVLMVWGSLRGGCVGPVVMCAGPARSHVPFTPAALRNLLIYIMLQINVEKKKLSKELLRHMLKGTSDLGENTSPQ